MKREGSPTYSTYFSSTSPWQGKRSYVGKPFDTVAAVQDKFQDAVMRAGLTPVNGSSVPIDSCGITQLFVDDDGKHEVRLAVGVQLLRPPTDEELRMIIGLIPQGNPDIPFVFTRMGSAIAECPVHQIPEEKGAGPQNVTEEIIIFTNGTSSVYPDTQIIRKPLPPPLLP